MYESQCCPPRIRVVVYESTERSRRLRLSQYHEFGRCDVQLPAERYDDAVRVLRVYSVVRPFNCAFS